MSSKFDTALKSTLNNETILSENGCNMFATSGKNLVDLNFAVSTLRGAEVSTIESMFEAAFFENPLYAVKWLFFARDIRGNGMGERRLFRVCFAWLAHARPNLVKKLIPLVAEYGRFDDLLNSGLEGDVWNMVVDYVADKFKEDLDNSFAGKPISLLAKWMPSVNTSSAATRALAKKLRIALGMDEKTYRKSLSSLRAKLKLVEVDVSANKWSDIDYNAVPSMANIKYKNAFLKHDEDRRKQYLSDLEKPESKAKINAAASFPCDIVHAYSNCMNRRSQIVEDKALEAMWKALPDYVAGNDTGSTIVVCDTSGSMESCVSGSSMTALEVAHSLAIYFSEKLVGPFKDKFISFSDRPKYIDSRNAKNLAEKLAIAYSNAEVANTDIKKTFMLILKTAVDNNLSQEDLPSNLLIVSDMNWDQGTYQYRYYEADKCALMKEISDEFAKHSYHLPKIVYWNVIGNVYGNRTAPIPVQANAEGAVLVSGFSTAIAKMVFSAKADPYSALIDMLDTPRYKPVEDAISEEI